MRASHPAPDLPQNRPERQEHDRAAMPDHPLRILIADDHAIIREGLKQILREDGGLCVVGEASSADEVLEKVRGVDCDVLLLDIKMPGGNVVDTLRRIKRERPGLAVLILSVYPEEQYAVSLLRAGASGYMTKETAPGQLLAAVRRVALGRKYVSDTLAEMWAAELQGDADRLPHQRLSEREFQVFCRLAEGVSVTAIADELALSVKTVSTHRTRLLQKMGMTNNAELTAYAIRNQLID